MQKPTTHELEAAHEQPRDDEGIHELPEDAETYREVTSDACPASE